MKQALSLNTDWHRHNLIFELSPDEDALRTESFEKYSIHSIRSLVVDNAKILGIRALNFNLYCNKVILQGYAIFWFVSQT